MKQTKMSFADYVHVKQADKIANKERAAIQSLEYDIILKTWPTREAMAKAIRKEEHRPWHRLNLMAIVPLSDGEGY